MRQVGLPDAKDENQLVLGPVEWFGSPLCLGPHAQVHRLAIDALPRCQDSVHVPPIGADEMHGAVTRQLGATAEGLDQVHRVLALAEPDMSATAAACACCGSCGSRRGQGEEGGIDALALADHGGKSGSVVRLSAADPMLAEDPDVTAARAWPLRRGRDDFTVGLGAVEDHRDLTRREAGHRQVEVDLDRRQIGEFQSQEVLIPAPVECDLVVGDAQRSLVRLVEAVQNDRRDLTHPGGFGSLKSAVAGNDQTICVYENRIGEAERFDRGNQLLDLPLRMAAGIARVRRQLDDRAINDVQAALRPASFAAGAHPFLRVAR